MSHGGSLATLINDVRIVEKGKGKKGKKGQVCHGGIPCDKDYITLGIEEVEKNGKSKRVGHGGRHAN